LCNVMWSTNSIVDHNLVGDSGGGGGDVEDAVLGKVMTYARKGIIAFTGSTVSRMKS
jgi:hypothetical protein